MKIYKMEKCGILSIVKMIPDEQDTEISYYLGQELAEYKMNFEEYEEEIKKVTKEEIVNLAQKVNIDTIFFLERDDMKNEKNRK